MSSDSLSSAIAGETITSFVADISLVGRPLSSYTTKAPARRIKVITAGGGALAVQYPNGVQQTLTVADGDVLDIQCAKILTSGTSVTKIEVYW
jgi:hypothetical protein